MFLWVGVEVGVRGWGWAGVGVGGDVFGPGNLFLPQRDPVYLFASNTKRVFTPVLFIFFPAKIGSWKLKKKSPPAHKIQMVAPLYYSEH